MRTAVGSDDRRGDELHLRVGWVSPESRVRREVALHPTGYLGRHPRRISPYSAVTIASWWRRNHSVLGALVDHYPASRTELTGELNVIAERLALEDTRDRFELNAISALIHFVANYDE